MAEHADTAELTGASITEDSVDLVESLGQTTESGDNTDSTRKQGEIHESDDTDESTEPARRARRLSTTATAILAGLVVLGALASLAGWLGWDAVKDRRSLDERKAMLEVARQGAVNLTTIDFNEVDADIARILASSVGTFHDDFQKRAQPFVDVVKQAQSKSVGTVTEAGLESQDGDRGRVLVAVSVKTSNVGGQDQQPRAWRMRIDVQKIDDTFKVSDVQFVA